MTRRRNSANRGGTHQCAAPGCRRMVARSYLMCGRHWHQVPRDLRDAVYDAWNARVAHPNVTTIGQHLEACAAAVAAIAAEQVATG